METDPYQSPMMPSSSHLLLRQATRATFKALISERTAIALVRQGEKRVWRGTSSLVIRPGHLAILPAGEPLTIENIPSSGGMYMASALVLGAGEAPVGDPDRMASDDRALAAFERAAAALEDHLMPASLREHMVSEVLLWLAQEGVGMTPSRPRGVTPRLRTLLAADLAARWTAPMAARALALSEATLRRRLAEEGTGFADVLADLRMTRALGLLQTTALPVNRIALDVGYECASRFAERFRLRFGITPLAVRGDYDRIGAAFDRESITGKRPVR